MASFHASHTGQKQQPPIRDVDCKRSSNGGYVTTSSFGTIFEKPCSVAVF